MTAPISTGLPSLQTALATVLDADATFSALVQRRIAFAGVAPETWGSKFPRLVIDAPAEGEANTYGRRGFEDSLFLHFWVAGYETTPAIMGYGHIARILRAPLTLAGGAREHWRGSVRLVGVVPSAQGEPAACQALIEYRARVQATVRGSV